MRLGDVFTSGMVLAARRPIRIFGYGSGEASVSFNGIQRTVRSEAEDWCVEFPAMEYGGPYELSFVTGDATVVLRDVYVGEVYLFAGQSNMSFPLVESSSDASVYEDNDKLRYLWVSPLPDGIAWCRARRDGVGHWSALGYLAGREIVRDRGVHVGIIGCATGASVIESWMPAGALERIGISIPMNLKNGNHYDERYAGWNFDGALYQSKLRRVAPLALSGVVWYQGESDASEAEARVYGRELSELIRIWRDDFGDAALPFVIVQIADCESRIVQGPGWRMLQAAQERLPDEVPHTYTVISRDVCETDDIHPKTKDKLAARIAAVIREHFFD